MMFTARTRRVVWPVVVVVGVALALSCGGSKKKSNEEVINEMDTPTRVRLAQSYFDAGRSNEALEIMDEAIARDPDNAGARNFYGQLLLLTGRLEDAETALQAALEIDPYMTDAHNNLGAVYDRLGRQADAEREYRKALEDPTYPTPEKVYLNLGLLYDSQGRLDEAISMLRKGVGINPKYYQAQFELAGLLERSGELSEAIQLYEVASPGYRTYAPYHYRLGLAYFRAGDPIKARQHLNRVQELSPGSESAAQAAKILAMID